MNKDFLSFNAQGNVGADLRFKFQLCFVFFFACFLNPFFAQDQKSQDVPSSDVVITVVGDALIYSKDESFNAQVSENKALQKNSQVELSHDNIVKIRGKASTQSSKTLGYNKEKTENVVLASKKSEKCKSKEYSKKYVDQQIKGLDNDGQFVINLKFGTLSFITPSNDSPSSTNSFVYLERPEIASLMYSYYINHLYKNSTAKTRVFNNDFSVRPPPTLI